MAVDYGMLSRIPSFGARFAAGQEAGRAAAAQNMLLQQRQMEFQQAQEDRRLAMEERRMQREAAAAQVARRGQLAQVLRQSGMDPSDMQAATQFYAAALEANEPTAIAAAKDWLSLAREAAQARAAGAEYQGIMGGGAPAAAPTPMATPMAAAPAPMTTPMAAPAPQQLSPLAVEQAAYQRPEFYGQGQFAGTAPTAITSPVGEFPSAPPSVNAMAPAAPPVNQLAAAPAPPPAAAPTPAPAKDDPVALRAEAQRLEAAQQRLRQSPFEKNQKRAQELDKPIERLYKRAEDIEKAALEGAPMVVGGRLVSRTGKVLYEPSPGAMTPTERFVPVGPNVFNRETGQFLPGPAREPSLRQAPEARVKPAAPIRVRPGEVVISPETGQPIFTAPPAPARAAAERAAAPGAAPAVGTPAQQAAAARRQTAQANLSQDIRTQLGYYESLAKMGGMTSPSRSVAENVAAYARSSGLGQEAERAIGTQAQTLRDNIKNTRQRLFMNIKDATGATAAQMNSNMEMQAWLDAMTNPQQSIETVRETLKQLDSVIAGVREQVAREAAAKGGANAAPAAAPAAPAAVAPRRREIAPGVFVTERP